MPYQALESADFPGVFLWLDGSWVTQPQDDGVGAVACSRGLSRLTLFNVHALEKEGQVQIESVMFPNVFLRLDASAVQNSSAAGGVVNCQLGAGPYETLEVLTNPDNSIAIATTTFGKTCSLRMDASSLESDPGLWGGTVNVQASDSNPQHSRFFLRTVTDGDLDPRPADWPFSFEPMRFILAQGMRSPKSVLSATSASAVGLDFWSTGDAQLWSVNASAQNPNAYNVFVQPPGHAGPKVLAAAADGSSVSLVDADDGSGRQQWLFEWIEDAPVEEYRMRVAGGLASNQPLYLTGAADGSGVSLRAKGALNPAQRWSREPGFRSLESDVPGWDYQHSVDLAQYLQKNAHRGAIRLFAKDVYVTADIVWRDELQRYPADIRVDCGNLWFKATNSLIDVSGTNAQSANLDSPGVIDWSSFVPDPTATPDPGQPGFKGGSVSVFAQTLHTQDAQSIRLSAAGGIGGAGRAGYLGRPASGPGLLGEPGGRGGGGGQGGDGGLIAIFYAASDDSPSSIAAKLTAFAPGAAGGAGGTGGAGGQGGPPAKPGDPAPPAGPTGANGSAGPKGTDGGAQVEKTDGVLLAMQVDSIPQSLYVRLQAATNRMVYQLVRGGDKAAFDDWAQWLSSMATAMQYDALVARIKTLQNTVAQYSSSATWQQDLRAHVMTIPPNTLQAEFIVLRNFEFEGMDSPAIAYYAAVRRRMLSARPPAVAGDPSDAPIGLPDAWISTLSGWIDSLQGSQSPVPLDTYIDDLACSTLDACALTAQLTPRDLGLPQGGVQPLFIPLLGFGFYLGVSAAFAAIGYSTWLEYGNLRQRQEAENKRRRQAQQQWEQDVSRWKQQQKDRDKLDNENRDNANRDVARERARKDRDKRKPNRPDGPVRNFGTEYVVKLFSVHPVEPDVKGGDATRVSALFDGVLLPRLSDVLDIAIWALVNSYMTFMFDIELTAQTKLEVGKWYRIRLKQGSDGTGYVFVNAPDFLAGKPSFDKSLIEVGEFPMALSGPPTLVPAPFAMLLDVVFQRGPSSLKPVALARPVLPFVRIANSAQVVAENVDHGSFHVFLQPPEGEDDPATNFAFDLGGYNALAISTDHVVRRLLQLVSSGATLVFSHWHKDHWLALANPILAPLLQALRIAGPVYYSDGGPTLINLLTDIASRGSRHLFLVGWDAVPRCYDEGPTVVDPNTRGSKAVALRLASQIADQPELDVPSNVTLALTAGTTAALKNPNDHGAIYVVVSGANNTRLLLPGDASYSYMSPAHKQNLTHLEATHHGSTYSILTDAFPPRRATDSTNSDIPPYAPAPGGAAQVNAPEGTVIYSYGPRHNISPDRSFEFYGEPTTKHWPRYLGTMDEGSDIDTVL
jgi:hypothetical protein